MSHQPLQSWQLTAATVDGVPGVRGRLRLPGAQSLSCEIAGLRLTGSSDGPVFRLIPGRPLAMRTVASGVRDADAAVAAADELFDALVELARPAPRLVQRPRRPAC